jgi:hypothetical protein
MSSDGKIIDTNRNLIFLTLQPIIYCMESNSKIIIILLLLLTYSITGCLKQEVFPVEPQITFNGFTKIQDSTGIDNRGVIEIGYTDGDGDIGLADSDTVPPYDYNLFMTYFEKQNGLFKQVEIVYFNDSTNQFDTLNMNARIPMLTPEGRHKAIKGIIQDTIFINNPLSSHDTIRFDIYIKDRALNVSNTVSTPEIIVKKK